MGTSANEQVQQLRAAINTFNNDIFASLLRRIPSLDEKITAIEEPDENGFTLLHHAATSNNIGAVKILLEQYTDLAALAAFINMPDLQDQTALRITSNLFRPEIAKILINSLPSEIEKVIAVISINSEPLTVPLMDVLLEPIKPGIDRWAAVIGSATFSDLITHSHLKVLEMLIHSLFLMSEQEIIRTFNTAPSVNSNETVLMILTDTNTSVFSAFMDAIPKSIRSNIVETIGKNGINSLSYSIDRNQMENAHFLLAYSEQKWQSIQSLNPERKRKILSYLHSLPSDKAYLWLEILKDLVTTETETILTDTIVGLIKSDYENIVASFFQSYPHQIELVFCQLSQRGDYDTFQKILNQLPQNTEINYFLMLLWSASAGQTNFIQNILDSLSDEKKLEVLSRENAGRNLHLTAYGYQHMATANLIQSYMESMRNFSFQLYSTQKPQRPVFLHDIVVHGVGKGTGEFGCDNVLSKTTPVPRLYQCIETLMTQAASIHKKNHFENKQIKKAHENDITRLITSEFSFYTREPLSTQEFNDLMTLTSDLAATLPKNLHIILSSFAVKTNDKEPLVANIAVHIECGARKKIKFMSKNYQSDIDPVYELPKTPTSSKKLLKYYDMFLNASTIDATSDTKIIIDSEVYTVFSTFNNTLICTTAGGQKFISTFEICYDHHKGVSRYFIGELIKHSQEYIPIQCAQIVSSNTIDLLSDNIVGSITHIDRAYSPHLYDALQSQRIVSNFNSPLETYVLPPRICGTLAGDLKLKCMQHNSSIMEFIPPKVGPVLTLQQEPTVNNSQNMLAKNTHSSFRNKK